MSRAKPNLSKSSILPIGLTDIPQWLCDKEFKILAPRLILRHLRVPIGYQVSTHSLLNYCLDKVNDRIAIWKECRNSFSRKITLIKHVLLAIPIFHMMAIHFSKTTSLQLQCMCKDFLWGFNNSSQRKTLLMAWKRIAQPHMQGGLDICLPYYQGIALLACWASLLLNIGKGILFRSLHSNSSQNQMEIGASSFPPTQVWSMQIYQGALTSMENTLNIP